MANDPAGSKVTGRLRPWEHPFDCVYCGGVTDECAEARREVIAELIDVAQRHAAGHEANYRVAVEHGRDDMAMRARSNQNAWLEVARTLRMDMSPPP